MNRVWTVLLLLATLVVAGAVGYVLVHTDNVPNAGETPGYTAPPPSGGRPSNTHGGSPTAGSTGGSGAGSSSASTDTKATRIAFLGDNWTKGAGTNHDKTKAFPDLVASGLHLKDTVAGSDGAGYAKKGPSGETYGDLVSKVADAKPDIVVVSGGRNDISDDVSTLNTAAKDLFASLKSKLPKAKLVAVAPFWGDSDHPADLSKVDSAVKAGVEAAGGTYLDIPDPIHNHPDWMSSDQANPNDQGNKAIAFALKTQLQKLL